MNVTYLFQLDKLINFLNENDVSRTRDKTIIFAETKRTVDFLEMMLSRVRIRTSAIHGDKTQVLLIELLTPFTNVSRVTDCNRLYIY